MTPTSTPDSTPAQVNLEELVSAARRLITTDQRHILGITGAPGAGKSTIAEALVDALGPHAALVSMDGFHLRDDELRRLGRFDRKGAPDTFDAAGFIHLLRRLRARTELITYAPVFDRGLEESIGSAQPIPDDVALIITEGNYLLVDDPVWSPVAELLDECWYVDPGEQTRMSWLVGRHLAFGRPLTEAVERAGGPDGANAAVTSRYRDRASWVIQLTTDHHGPTTGSDTPPGTLTARKPS